MTRVAIIKSANRTEGIKRALSAIEQDIRPARKILIKPNLVSTSNQLASTHVDAVRGVIAFLKERTDAEITVGEASSTRDTLIGFKNLGYRSLQEEYGVKLVDLNRDRWVRTRVFDGDLTDIEVRVARTVVESDYRISVCLPKTHDTVLVTLSLKNMAVGSLIRDERGTIRTLGGLAWQLFSTFILKNKKTLHFVECLGDTRSPFFSHSDKITIHRGVPAINMTLARLTPLTYPHLSVIDGTTGMEGDGPTKGKPVNLGLCIAGTDFLAVDTITARIMGFDPGEIGYLSYLCSLGMGVHEVDRIEILGEKLADCVRPFEPHSTRGKQAQWRLEGAVEKLREILPARS